MFLRPVSLTMTFRVQEMRQILGPQLHHLWVGDRSRDRAVTCITYIERADDVTGARPGELAVVAGDWALGACVLDLLDGDSGRPAAVLLPATLPLGEQRRAQTLAAQGSTAIGMLAA